MATRDTCALLICGNEQWDMDRSLEFLHYLTEEAKFEPYRVWGWADYLDGHILDKTKKFLQEAKAIAPNEGAVIIYNGHGIEGGIRPSTWGQNYFISYENLAQVCKDHEVLFINNSCHSGSAIPIFEKSGILPRRGSIIASADSNELSYGEYFQNTLLDTFRERKPYQKRKIVVMPRLRYKTGFEFHKLKFNPVTEKDEVTEVRYDYKIAPAIIQHPQRCGLSLDHLLFPQ